jgi:DNA-binding CsgD family transcriptional regulator
LVGPNPKMKKRSLSRARSFPDDAPGRYVSVSLLSEAEERLIYAALAGNTSRERLATALAISPHTVRSHLSHIYDKIGGENVADLVLWALKKGYTFQEVEEDKSDDDLCGG